MSPVPLNGGEVILSANSYSPFNFEPSWVGPSPATGAFCLGSEDGRLLFLDEAGRAIGAPVKVADSAEAVNGVARLGDWIAVSTRCDVTLVVMNQKAEGANAIVIPQGAHGIGVSPGGYFLGPLGRMGILVLKPGRHPDDPVNSLSVSGGGMYFYRVLPLAGVDGKDAVIASCRRGGVGIVEFRWGDLKSSMQTSTFNGLDVVDVCSVAPDANPPAVVAVGRDGTLILYPDVLRDKKPLTLKFDAVQGVAYRVLSNGNHLFLLTSVGLYALMGLAKRVTSARLSEESTTSIMVMSLDIVDANLVADRWLLIITPDALRMLDVQQIERSEPKNVSNSQRLEEHPRIITPNWEHHTASQLVGVAG